MSGPDKKPLGSSSYITYKYISTTPVYSIVFSLNITYPCPTSLDLCVRSPNPPLSRASRVACSTRPLRTSVLAVSDVWTPSDFGPRNVQRPDFVPSTLKPPDSLGLSSTLFSSLQFHLNFPLPCLASRASHWSGQRATVR